MHHRMGHKAIEDAKDVGVIHEHLGEFCGLAREE